MQSRFWEFHDRLFNESDRLNDERIIEIAAEVGLDVAQFEKDLEDHRTLALVRRDILIGLEAGVDMVPTVFVNGRLVKNGSLERLETLIQRELANSAEKDPKSGA
jgi:predicted DsbA family dithiol-disulfide isomerase